MKTVKIIFIISLCYALASCAREKGKDMADIILLNGAVWTAIPDLAWAEAVAIKEERILDLGSSSKMRRLAGAQTKIVDLKGSLVLPGFIDCHTHFLDGGFALSSVQLREARSREEFISRIAGKARELSKGEWILNGSWDHQQFSPPELPQKEWIDPVTPQNPVCVNRHDGHMVLANSLALKLAGITQDTRSPRGGEIVKDPATGEPTGILKDAALDLVMRHIPEPSLPEKRKAAEAALRHAREYGVTSIHDMSGPDSFEVYQELLRENRLTSRLYVFFPITEVDHIIRLKLKTPFGTSLLRVAGLKGFVDGSLGSSTALFFEPYLDDPGKTGLLFPHMFPEGIMEKRLLQADQAGLQAAVHAIGDRANRIILDIFEKVMETNSPRDRRWRVEHAQHLQPEDIERFGRLGVIASVQPYHAIDDGRWAEKKIGSKRAQTTYAFRSLLDTAAILACGSDWTVAPLDPLSGIFAAVTRQTQDGQHLQGWVPEQKITLEEALRGYTINAAYAEFSEKEKGSIEKGKLADLVVLDQDLFKIRPEKIQGCRVLMTVFNGRVVFERAQD